MQKKKEWLKEYANTKGNLFSYVLSAQDIKTDKSEFLSPIFPIPNFQEKILLY
ncbi:hypothetical protein LEP1GSC060_0423 [Leptospira weilii serovar Ranarum str. ICFT]|uniref:Uncharacterized protein n=1 Tax=Leptospira weilii serovar Ranarum str. ICFT TaxID=1218598 RepID=N1WUN7_9LEPT|nr:hypothetical protein LEP1GSC060_0423 [Leptospira weilii serovar Ranarum str. ICFT]